MTSASGSISARSVLSVISAERIVAGIADPAADHNDTTLRLMELLGAGRGISKRRTA